MFQQYITLEYSFDCFYIPILAWEEGSTSLTTWFLFVQPRVHAIVGETRVERVDAVTVRAGVAEEDFEGATSGCHSE